MSHIGEQLVAPEGCGPLFRGRVYHYLGRFGKRSRVALVAFDTSPPAAHLQSMENGSFEKALNSGAIVRAAEQAKLPPWLPASADGDLSTLDAAYPPARRARLKQTNEERLNKRLDCIRPLVTGVRKLLGSDDPRQEVGRFARQCMPELNESRTWLWFCTYLAFGRNKWALLPAYKGRTGTWVRTSDKAKAGRFSISRGRRFGYARCQSFIDTTRTGWDKYKGIGVFMTTIVQCILTEKFGCHVREVDGKKEFYHPQGEPFPTAWQIRYEILKFVGREAVQLALYGEVRVRTRKRASKGKFSEVVANLLERLNADAYTVDEVPIGVLDGEPMPALYVVRIRCLLSGLIVGIGFSMGGERADAYRMALFSMAMPKDEFCALFGITIDKDVWPSEGWPSWATFDRGPGSIAALIEEQELRIPITEITPSWQGQSNAAIETTHPRKLKSGGGKTYRQSAHNYVALAKREIERTIAQNQSIDMSDHLTPVMIRARVMPTPLGLWRYFDKRRRTDAHPVQVELAVRCLLTPVEFTVHEDGVYLHAMRYDSPALRETDLNDRVIAEGVFAVRGYVVDVTARQAWLEANGQLVRVEAMLPIRDHKGQLFLSLRELADLERVRAIIRSNFNEHRTAVQAESRLRFADNAGKDWDAGSTKSGRAKRRTPQARQEYADTRQALTGGGRKR